MELKDRCGGNAIVMDHVVDGTSLLSETDIFVGSGGTMNCEASLLGIPNISYNMQNIAVNRFLVRNGVSYSCTNVNDVIKLVRKTLKNENIRKSIAKKGKRLLAQMEDPKNRIVKVLEQAN